MNLSQKKCKISIYVLKEFLSHSVSKKENENLGTKFVPEASA